MPRWKLTTKHIRDMLLYIVADAQRPSWIVPEVSSLARKVMDLIYQYKNAIAHTVVLFVPGLLPGHLGLAPIPVTATLPFSTAPSDPSTSTKIPIIPKLFTYGCPTRAPGDQRRLHSVTGAFLTSPLPDHVRKQREEQSRRLAGELKVDIWSPC